MNISAVEATWLLLTVIALATTWDNLVDSWHGWRAVRHTGRAREVYARANVRREAVGIAIEAALLVLVIPALFRPGDTPITWGLVVIMAIPVGVALNSYLDRRTRKTIAGMVA